MLLATTDVDELVHCWRETMAGSPIVRPYNPRRNSLVFSFDDNFSPFLNYTKGYHHPKSKRFYFKTVPRVIREIANHMVPYRGTGGRVFLNKQKAFYVDETLVSTDVCELTWPKSRDVIAEIVSYWRASRQRAAIKLTNVKWN